MRPRTDPPFPEWFAPLGAVGKVVSYRILPKGGGYEVKVHIPTGHESHEVVLVVPRSYDACNRYAMALIRVAKVLQDGLPPAQRKLLPPEEPNRM